MSSSLFRRIFSSWPALTDTVWVPDQPLVDHGVTIRLLSVVSSALLYWPVCSTPIWHSSSNYNQLAMDSSVTLVREFTICSIEYSILWSIAYYHRLPWQFYAYWPWWIFVVNREPSGPPWWTETSVFTVVSTVNWFKCCSLKFLLNFSARYHSLLLIS